MIVPLADLEIEQVGPVVVARVEGEIDMSNAYEIGDAISRQLAQAALGLILDLLAVTYIDSAGIRVIYELHERLHARGQGLRLAVAPDAPIADALRIAEVTATIDTFPTLEDARASVDP